MLAFDCTAVLALRLTAVRAEHEKELIRNIMHVIRIVYPGKSLSKQMCLENNDSLRNASALLAVTS